MKQPKIHVEQSMLAVHSEPISGPRNLAELDERASRPSPAVITIAQGLVGRILVLGAGGKMGFHLTYMLKRALGCEEHSSQLLAVSRFGSPTAVERFHQHGLTTLSCDLLDNQALMSLPDADCIFYLAGVKFGASSDLARLLNRAGEGNMHLRHATAAAPSFD